MPSTGILIVIAIVLLLGIVIGIFVDRKLQPNAPSKPKYKPTTPESMELAAKYQRVTDLARAMIKDSDKGFKNANKSGVTDADYSGPRHIAAGAIKLLTDLVDSGTLNPPPSLGRRQQSIPTVRPRRDAPAADAPKRMPFVHKKSPGAPPASPPRQVGPDPDATSVDIPTYRGDNPPRT